MNVVRVVKRFLGIEQVDQEAARRLEQQHEEDVERALRDPFRFASWEHYAAFCRRHGVRPNRGGGWLK